MHKKNFAVILLTVSFIIGIVLWGRTQPTDAVVVQQPHQSQPAAPRSEELPEHIFYGEVFSLLAKLKNSADYQREASLTNDETASLMKIAMECEADVAAQDAKAKVVIQEFRKKIAKSNPSRKPQPVPRELELLQAEREAIAIRHRDRLKKALGDDAFRRFTAAAKKIVNITLKPIQPQLP